MIAWAVALSTLGCAAKVHPVTFAYTAPPQMSVGAAVQRLLVADRGDGVAPAIRRALAPAVRFQLMTVRVGGADVVDEQTAIDLCRPVQCDAVLVVTGFQTEADQDAIVTVQLRAPDGSELASSESPLGDLQPTTVAIHVMQQLVNHGQTATRSLEQVGKLDLGMGANPANSEEWQAAGGHWRALVADSTTNARAVARARHNLAVAMEREGQLDRALQLARNAAPDNRRTEAYVLALEERWVESRVLSANERELTIWQARFGAPDSEGVAGE